MLAGFVQGISGFAFGMVAMSFWVWGVEPHVAAVMTVFGSLVGQLLAVTREKRTPSRASVSRFGVTTPSSPAHPIMSPRC